MNSSFRGVPARPQVDEDVAPVRKRAEPCAWCWCTTYNTFGRSYRIRTRITDVAAPDVVGPAGHGRGAAFRGGQPGRFVGSRGRGGPSGLLCMNGLHRGCARGAGRRAPVCRCAATRRSKREIERRRRPFRGRRVRETLHMTPWPTTTKTRFANLKNSEPAPLFALRASSTRKSAYSGRGSLLN